MADIDGLIEELAFGKVRRKPGPCLGMYLSPDVIYISETHLDGAGKIVIDHLVRIPVPAPEKPIAQPTGTLNSDFLSDNQKLVAIIKQSMGSIKWSTKDVIVTLSHHLGLLRYFTMPAIDRRYWANAVPLEAKKYIPIPLDTLQHDFQVLPMPPDASNKPRQGALICVTQKRNLTNIQSLLEGLGLTMIGMEVAPCSTLRLWENLDKGRANKTHVQVHFDGGAIRILLADRGVPVFFRELFLGQEAQLNDLRKIDLAGCIGFAQKQLGVGAVGQSFVSGSVGNVAQWQESFAKELEAAPQALDLPARLGIKAGDWGGYASIGASLRTLAPTAVALDLCQIGRVTEDERRVARDILVIGIVLAGFFALSGLYRVLNYEYQARELSKYKRDAEMERVFQNKPKFQVDEMLKNMRTQLQAADVALNDSLKVTTLLSEAVNNLPENTWLTSVRLLHPMRPTPGDALQLTLFGRAKANTMQSEQDLAFEYRQRLLAAPTIGKAFRNEGIQVEVSGKPLPDNVQGTEPSRLQEMLEERTSFQVAMKRRLQ